MLQGTHGHLQFANNKVLRRLSDLCSTTRLVNKGVQACLPPTSARIPTHTHTHTHTQSLPPTSAPVLTHTHTHTRAGSPQQGASPGWAEPGHREGWDFASAHPPCFPRFLRLDLKPYSFRGRQICVCKQYTQHAQEERDVGRGGREKRFFLCLA